MTNGDSYLVECTTEPRAPSAVAAWSHRHATSTASSAQAKRAEGTFFHDEQQTPQYHLAWELTYISGGARTAGEPEDPRTPGVVSMGAERPVILQI